ncbi:MAG TPA: hypothetical protein VFI61_03965 [Patescibacteria group bacterium]|nr:hypothetical protein [Patescibacteria group bacterium]
MQLLFGTIERKILTIFFIASIAYLAFFLYTSGYKQHPLGVYTQIPLIVMPLFTGMFGLTRVRLWGGFKTLMGQAMFGLSLAAVIFGIGFLIWTFYIFSGIAFPFPSLADYVFVWFSPVWAFGLIQLSRVIGASAGIRAIKALSKEKIIFLIVIIGASALSYYVSIAIAGKSQIPESPQTSGQIIFNAIYNYQTIFHLILLSGAYILSRNYLGGIYKSTILILFAGFILHYLAVVFFAYTTITLTYFNGNIADIFYTLAEYFQCLGILNLDPGKVLRKN